MTVTFLICSRSFFTIMSVSLFVSFLFTLDILLLNVCALSKIDTRALMGLKCSYEFLSISALILIFSRFIHGALVVHGIIFGGCHDRIQEENRLWHSIGNSNDSAFSGKLF